MFNKKSNPCLSKPTVSHTGEAPIADRANVL